MFEVERPLVLITNDDGYFSPGLRELTNCIKPLADVMVVAPETPQSAQSSALTVVQPIRLSKLISVKGFEVYKCSGTPVDCVKLALDRLCDRKPDLLLSGINNGPNSSISVLYSGTIGSVLEGAVYDIPAVGLSLCDINPNADFTFLKPYVTEIVKKILKEGLMGKICLNVNIPMGEVKGIKLCRQARGHWKEEFEQRVDPSGKDYYWLTGYFVNEEPDAEDTDERALRDGYISVVPCKIDMTAYETFPRLRSLEKINIEEDI